MTGSDSAGPDPAGPVRAPARRAVRRNPEPSLLRSLLNDHLDPGYAAAARRRRTDLAAPGIAGRAPVPGRWRGAGTVWASVGLLLAGVVFGVAAADRLERDTGGSTTGRAIAADVRAQQDRNAGLDARYDELATQVRAQRDRELAGSVAGDALLAELTELEQSSAAVAVSGPGLEVVVGEPSPGGGLRRDDGRTENGQVVLDTDLQAVVNALWAGGAEAIAIGGVRVGPGVAVRQAGGAILIDQQPVPSPYLIEAIGPQRMQADFLADPVYLRLEALAGLYGVGLQVRAVDDLQLPAAQVRELRSAGPSGG